MMMSLSAMKVTEYVTLGNDANGYPFDSVQADQAIGPTRVFASGRYVPEYIRMPDSESVFSIHLEDIEMVEIVNSLIGQSTSRYQFETMDWNNRIPKFTSNKMFWFGDAMYMSLYEFTPPIQTKLLYEINIHNKIVGFIVNPVGKWNKATMIRRPFGKYVAVLLHN